jgi:hypothetical protein
VPSPPTTMLVKAFVRLSTMPTTHTHNLDNILPPAACISQKKLDTA